MDIDQIALDAKVYQDNDTDWVAEVYFNDLEFVGVGITRDEAITHLKMFLIAHKEAKAGLING